MHFSRPVFFAINNLISFVLLSALLSGCSTLAYYYQAASGHLDVMARAQPFEDYRNDASAHADVKAKLDQIAQIRHFASSELGLPDNASYTRYADLERPYAVWNVYAAPALSTDLVQWCFLVAGCVEYRGYFSQQDALDFAQEMRLQNYDVFVDGVRAYSTLGWFSDPVLNTFIKATPVEIARLIFHELAHQLLYVADDSVFNESFATAVELEGVERWLEKFGTTEMKVKFEQSQQRRLAFSALALQYREALRELYGSGLIQEEKLKGKAKLLAELSAKYEAFRKTWHGTQSRDRWSGQQLNNAHLGSIAIYAEHVPAFQSQLRKNNGDLSAFYAEVKELAQQPKSSRNRYLHSLKGD